MEILAWSSELISGGLWHEKEPETITPVNREATSLKFWSEKRLIKANEILNKNLKKATKNSFVVWFEPFTSVSTFSHLRSSSAAVFWEDFHKYFSPPKLKPRITHFSSSPHPSQNHPHVFRFFNHAEFTSLRHTFHCFASSIMTKTVF